MEPSTGRTIAYTGNNAYDNTTNIYGNVHGDVHFPGASGQPGPYQCLRDLRVTDPRQDRARIEQEKDSLLKDCYAWVLEDPDFQRWRTQDDSHMLWIKGDPGKGKTMMTMGLIDELSRMDSEKQSSNMFSNMLTKLGLGSNPGRCLMAYFFCQNTRPELNNATSVLRGLIFLLVTEREELMRHVQKRYEAVGKQLFEGPNAIFALRGILSDILNDPSLPTTYLLVDALDECVYGLKDLLHIITDNKIMPGSRVKWLVTSRNIPEIERFLYSNTIGFKINLELNASHVSKAITAFINFKVDRLAGIQKYNIKTREEVQQQLYDKAEGTFLWVWLVCKELEGVPLYRTQFVLKELPPGLNPLYDRMMKHILAQKDADTVQFCKDILRSITLAYRPLHIKELAITADLPNKLFKEVQEVIDMVGHCGSFLTFQGSTVSFVHLSAKDYFLNGPGLHVFDGTVIQEHQRIASRLLDAIHIMLQRDICNFQNPGIRIQEAKSHIDTSVIPQIAYACEYWIDHLQTYVESNEDFLVDNGRVHTFLSEDILHWLEAMSFIQRMPEAVVLIRTLHSMFNVSSGSVFKEIIELLSIRRNL
jgi:hypothetical protein